MKKIIISLFFVFVAANNASAINLGDALKEISQGSSNEITKNLEKKIDKIINKYDGQLQGEVKKYKDKIDKEEKKVRAMIDEAQRSVEKLKEIKEKAGYYIKITKIVLAILSSAILILIFVIWRIYCNVVALKKMVKNVSNYDNFDKRLKILETRVK